MLHRSPWNFRKGPVRRRGEELRPWLFRAVAQKENEFAGQSPSFGHPGFLGAFRDNALREAAAPH